MTGGTREKGKDGTTTTVTTRTKGKAKDGKDKNGQANGKDLTKADQKGGTDTASEKWR